MGSRSVADTMKAIGKDRVLVHGSFRPNGSSGIVAGSTKGRGFTVARTSIGLYTITLDHKWPALIGHAASVRSADGAHVAGVFGDYDSSAGTIQLRVRKGAPIHHNLDLSAARIIAANAIQNLTEAGVPDGNTDPVLERVNGATDKALRLRWAATSVVEVAFPPIMVPRAAEGANAVTVDLMIEKNGNTDTSANIDVQAWSGKGDTEMGAATSALSSATLGRKSVTLAAADVGANPGFLNLQLVPSAHANDAIHLYGGSVEFDTLVDLTADADNEIAFSLIMRNSDSNY